MQPIATSVALALAALFHRSTSPLFAQGFAISAHSHPLTRDEKGVPSPELCIGDMCAPATGSASSTKDLVGKPEARLQRGRAVVLPHSRHHEEARHVHPQANVEMLKKGVDPMQPGVETVLTIPAACDSTVPPSRRILLMPVVPQFHGSTALEGVFMSSSNVATLCRSNVWQCEAHFIYQQRGLELHDARDLLETYSSFWNLSQPVLLDKGPRDLNKIRWEQAELERERQLGLPAAMTQAGIEHLDFVYVLMWRPICLSVLSHNARWDIEKNATGFAYSELLLLEQMVQAHRYLTSSGYNPLVMNLADIMWRPERSRLRINHFLPCMGELDFSFKPVMDKDVFPGNQWKSDGSVKEFGETTDPEDCCSYDVLAGRCYNETNLFKLLGNMELQKRAEAALHYLKILS